MKMSVRARKSRAEGSFVAPIVLASNQAIFILLCLSMIDEISFLPNSWLLIVAYLIGGFYLLCKGGDWLADNASALAKALGASPTVIGLTVVSMATSAPELFTCMNAAIKGSGGLVVGNLVGSNFANIGLILGFALMRGPIRPANALSWWQMPFLLVSSLIFTALCLFHFPGDSEMSFSRWDGGICIMLMLAFLFFLKKDGRIEGNSQEEGSEASAGKCITFIIIASLMLWLGSEALVRGSISFAIEADLDEAIIGFILLAIGTSLPELAASYSLVRRGNHAILLGNIAGSNIFNLLLVGGVTSVIQPYRVEESLFIEFPAMLFVTALMWWFLCSKKALGKTQGILLLTIYFVIIAAAAYFPIEARTWAWW